MRHHTAESAFRAAASALRAAAAQADERAATMQGIPNEIARAEGYADGMADAAELLEMLAQVEAQAREVKP